MTSTSAIYVAINAVLVGSRLVPDPRARAARPGDRAASCAAHLFGHLTTLSLRYFSEQRAGWIIARLTSDVDALSDVLSEGLATLVAQRR